VFDSYTDIFTKRARSYHEAMTRVPRARDTEFRAVVAPIEEAPDGIVCDMPSGGCYLARYLRSGMTYVAVEPTAEFLDLVPIDSVRTLHAPITDVPLPDGSVDHVISLAGLHHEESLSPVLLEMRRLVKRGGRVVIADIAVDSAPARFLNGFVARNNPIGHDGRFLDAEMGKLLEGARLAVVDDAVLNLAWEFVGVEQAGEFCRDLFGITNVDSSAVAEALRFEIGFDVVDAMTVRLPWPMRRIVCEVG
jgi:SAM-dependent methyltransferase